MSRSLTWRATFCFRSRKPCMDDRRVTDRSEDDAKVLMTLCHPMTKFQCRQCPATKSHGFLVEQNPVFRYSLSDTLFTLFFFEFLYEITTIGSSLVLACMDSFYVCTGVSFIMSFSGGTSGKEPSCQCKLDETRAGSIPGWGRRPGGGHGNPLQYSCLENPMDRGAWLVTIHRIAKVRHDWNDLARRHTLVYHIRVWCFSE